MLRAVLAVLLLAPALVAAQPADSLVTLPYFQIPVRSDFRPPQTSAARAYLYSVTATGALVGLGYLVYRYGPQSNGTVSSTNYSQDVGLVLIASGAIGGPMIGNLSLGAGDDLGRAVTFKGVGIVGGSVLLGVALGSTGLCVVTGPHSGGCLLDPLAVGAFYGGIAVLGAGLAIGIVYDLATIPGNARWAQRARANGNRVPAREVRVSVAPGYDPRYDAPMGTIQIAM